MEIKNKKPDFYNLSFDLYETRTMFVSDYKNGSWDEGNLVPFGDISLSPAACVLNYGQAIFEGLKALKTKNGEILLFRPKDNGRRLNESAKRLLMPTYDVDRFVKNVKDVVKANQEYVPPYDSGGSLYIRPLMIGSGPMLGIAPATEFKLLIFCSPVGPYFPEGFNGIKIEISNMYTRASVGGTGYSKMSGNYAGTMKPAKEAKQKGYSQILYLDSVHKEYLSEVGAANFCAIIEETLVTPQFDGTILEGITLKSILTLAKEKLGMNFEQRDILYNEIFEISCTEAFCTGTAAVITPISSVSFNGNTRTFNDGKPGPITTKLYELLIGIQRLDKEDDFGWIDKVE